MKPMQETRAIVQRGFPSLSRIPAERIEYAVHGDFQAQDTWVSVLGDTWAAFERDPPKKMSIQITDEPGDEAASQFIPKTAECLISTKKDHGEALAASIVCAVFLLILGFASYFGWLMATSKGSDSGDGMRTNVTTGRLT